MEADYCMEAISEIRKSNVRPQLFPDKAKMKKQMNYADQKNIPFVALIGSEEVERNVFKIKNMKSGEHMELNLEELITLLEEFKAN